MVQKIHPQGVIWVPSISPHAGRLSEKNDDLAVQYEDVREYHYHNLVWKTVVHLNHEMNAPNSFAMCF